jgi:retron-type reverse transcriptase
MLSGKNLYQGYLGVKKAKGSAGIDGQTIAEFGQALERNDATLVRELREKTYRPLPVLRKEILTYRKLLRRHPHPDAIPNSSQERHETGGSLP